MVPVLWATGYEVSRRAPHTPSAELQQMLQAADPTLGPNLHGWRARNETSMGALLRA
ncbi:MAG: hypothetical protein ACOY0T_18955 [Myxococcota bacterium]